MTDHRIRRSALLTLAVTSLALAGCATTAEAPNPTPTTAEHETHDHTVRGEKEVSSLTPRALIAHEGGLTLIDTVTGDALHEEALDGFLRLNAAGDGQHVVVTDSDVFRVFDTGIRAAPHGDHDHLYESAPHLTDVTYNAPQAGHVTPHSGFTALFSDGTGGFDIVESKNIGNPDADVVTRSSGAAHHGVAIVLSDDTVLTTKGTADARSTVAALDANNTVLAETTNCPGVHGEAAASPNSAGDVVVFGCEDGPVIYKNGTFTKVAVTDAYARSGNLAGSSHSSVVLGDYKIDKKEHPTRVSLIDTASDTLSLVELDSPYWFRSLARGGEGEALVLTGDGSVRVIDPATGKQTAKIDAIGAWTEPAEWQTPGPALKAEGNIAYVLDPAANELVTIDIAKAEVIARLAVPKGAVELAVVTGHAAH